MPDDGELDLDLPPAPKRARRKTKDPLRVYRRNAEQPQVGPPFGFDDLPGRIEGWRDVAGAWGATESRYLAEQGILWDDRHPRIAAVLEAWHDVASAEWELGLRVAVWDRPSSAPGYDTWNAWAEAFADDLDEWTTDVHDLFDHVARARVVTVAPNRYL